LLDEKTMFSHILTSESRTNTINVDEGRGSLNGLQRPLLESASRMSRGANQKLNQSREELSFEQPVSEVPDVLIYPNRSSHDQLQTAFMEKLSQNKNE